jgi:hypothetical protein
MAASSFPERARLEWRSLRRSRLQARAPRYLFAVLVLILCALGLRDLLGPPATSKPLPVPAAADAPSEDFALQFARAYLTYDSAHPGRRAADLAPFVGERFSATAGLELTEGAQRVLWADVASDQPDLAGGRVVTVAAAVTSQSLPLYLAVDVRHRRGSPLELLGYPALVGAPAIAADPEAPSHETVDDPALSQIVRRVLRNYLALAAADLKADLAPGAAVTLPTRPLRLEEISELAWLGEPGSEAVLATLTATDAGGTTYTLTYELGIAYRDRPYVDFIEVVPTAS